MSHDVAEEHVQRVPRVNDLKVSGPSLNDPQTWAVCAARTAAPFTKIAVTEIATATTPLSTFRVMGCLPFGSIRVALPLPLCVAASVVTALDGSGARIPILVVIHLTYSVAAFL